MNTVETLIQHGQVLNVHTREFEQIELWINAGHIVATGPQPELTATEIVDATGKYIVPGMIDAHMHVESSLVTPSELGRVLLQRGVTAVVADPHEIANVEGVDGIQFMLDNARKTPLDVYYMLPSSVPATPFDHSGANLRADKLRPFYAEPEVKGLGEVMDFEGVLKRKYGLMHKIKDAKAAGYHVDGHCAGLNLKELKRCVKAGITTDHEATNVDEVNDRLEAGLIVFLREGTVERDLLNTIGAVTEDNADRFAFCTDDKLIDDIVAEGSIDFNVQLAIQAGIRPELAYTMASWNAAQAHQLDEAGALEKGFQADIVLLDDLNSVSIDRVMKSGQWIDDLPWIPIERGENSIHESLHAEQLKLPLTRPRANVIGIQPNHIVTDHLKMTVPVENGEFQPDLENDVLKIVSIERHKNLGTVGVGLVRGFQLTGGAIASSIAHDAHNLIAAGTSDEHIMEAVETVHWLGGGIVVIGANFSTTVMPLSIAGLMSSKRYESVLSDLDDINTAATRISPNRSFNPFITLSFLTLPVIPSIKITDQGLYDFEQKKFIPVEIGLGRGIKKSTLEN